MVLKRWYNWFSKKKKQKDDTIMKDITAWF